MLELLFKSTLNVNLYLFCELRKFLLGVGEGRCHKIDIASSSKKTLEYPCHLICHQQFNKINGEFTRKNYFKQFLLLLAYCIVFFDYGLLHLCIFYTLHFEIYTCCTVVDYMNRWLIKSPAFMNHFDANEIRTIMLFLPYIIKRISYILTQTLFF